MINSSKLHAANEASATNVRTSDLPTGILPVQRFETVAGRKPTDFAAVVKLGTLLRNNETFNLRSSNF